MNQKLSNTFSGLLFAALILGSGFIHGQLKSELTVFVLLFVLVILGSLVGKPPLKSSIPFYFFLGTLLFIHIFFLTNFIVSTIFPMDGLVIDTNGEKQRVMQMNWVWGFIAGLVLSPLTVFLYHKKIKQNKVLEILLTTLFIILTVIINLK